MRTKRLFGSIVTTALMLTGVVLLLSDVAAAQRGGFSAEAMMDRMDENGNGRLDPDELSESRIPIADMAKKAGIDPSRGLDADDVTRVFEEMQRMREESSGFGGGFGGFGGDRSSRGGDRSGRGTDRGGSDRSGSDRGGRGGDRSSRSKAPEPPPRVTVDLQATYLPGDTNGDGQIELSEWLRWKSRAALTEFISLDRNTDGILTPRELAQTDNVLPVDLATFLPGAHPAALQPASGSPVPSNPTMATDAGTSTATTPLAGAASPAGAASTIAPSASSDDVARYKASAQRSFRLLDRDRDGNINDLEWRRSILLRPKFEAVGADLSQPMSEQQFTEYYVKFSSAS